jgi:hypothetical protein
MAIEPQRHIRRDRHERGLRGPLLPHNVPKRTSPDEKFQAQVLMAITQIDQQVSQLEKKLASRMKQVTFNVEAVPSKRDVVLSDGTVPMGRIERGNPDVVVLYQRAIELRSFTSGQQKHIVKDVLAELLGLLFGKDPAELDPTYQGPQLTD